MPMRVQAMTKKKVLRTARARELRRYLSPVTSCSAVSALNRLILSRVSANPTVNTVLTNIPIRMKEAKTRQRNMLSKENWGPSASLKARRLRSRSEPGPAASKANVYAVPKQ